MTEITLKVVGKAVADTDTIRNKCSWHIVVESKTVDKGEDDFEEVGEGQVGLFFPDGAPIHAVV